MKLTPARTWTALAAGSLAVLVFSACGTSGSQSDPETQSYNEQPDVEVSAQASANKQPAAAPGTPGTPGAMVAMSGAEKAAGPAAGGKEEGRPPKLDTGFDLSKIRVPVTNPRLSTAAIPSNGNTANAAPGAAGAGAASAQPAEPVALTSIAYGEDGGEHDFGEMIQGDVNSYAFRFTNAGENELTLSQIKPSCGCTIAQTMVVGADGALSPYVLGTPLAPGAELELTAQLNTRGKHGPVHSNINLFCNVENGVSSLKLAADVKTFLDLEPQNLNFEKLRAGETRTGTITVSSSIADRFKLELDESLLPSPRDAAQQALEGLGYVEAASADGEPSQEFHVELVPIEPDANGAAARWNVNVTVGPEASEGSKSYPVRLFSDQLIEGAPAGPDGQPARHEALAYVMAQVTGVVDIEPRYLSFGLVRPGQVLSKSISVFNYDDNWVMPEPEVSVVGFRGEFEQAQYVSTSVAPLEGGTGYEVTLTVDGMPEDFNGSFRGKLVIETGHPKKPSVEAPFSGVVRGVVARPEAPAASTPAEPQGDGHDHDHGGGGHE